MAAENGYAPAADNLGYMYTTGAGVERNYHEAIKWFTIAANLGYEDALNNLAWSLATVPDDKLRDGKRAIDIVETMMNSGKNEVGLLDTLAASYAEAGLFERAIQLQQQAIDSLQSTNQPERLKNFQRRLDNYKNHKPWRMP